MTFPSIKLFLLTVGANAAWALPSSLDQRADSKPAAFLLAGDSTTAKNGGWGDGFISDSVEAPAIAVNYGHSGATTVSFKAGGDWKNVLAGVTKYKPTNDVYVTIQFGHNDQKESANISLSEYVTNLGNFAADVKAAGGTPILVTPLTRRTFSGNPKRVVENLSNERNTTIAEAQKTDTWFIDLNKASTDYVNNLGPDAADQYNLKEGDRTHLNPHGSVVFARIVADLLSSKYPQLASGIKPDAAMTALISAGKPA